jgi:hypothetical protein
MTTYGVKPLRKIQAGREATQNTAVPATFIWRGPANMPEDDRTIIRASEDTGQLMQSSRTYVAAEHAQMTWDSCEAVYELLGHIFDGGINAESPTADGAGTDYIREYVFGVTTNVPKFYTIEGGDNIDVAEMQGSFVQEFTLSGTHNAGVMLDSVLWNGLEYTDASFTAALALIAVEDILFNKGKLYIDNAAFGSTQATGIWTSFTMNVDTGYRRVPVSDGELTASIVKNIGPTITLNLTLESHATTAAERALFRAQTARFVRMIFTGSTFATPGTTYSVATLIVDIRGQYTEFSIYEDADGDNVVTATVEADDTSSTPVNKIILVNDIAAL